MVLKQLNIENRFNGVELKDDYIKNEIEDFGVTFLRAWRKVIIQ